MEMVLCPRELSLHGRILSVLFILQHYLPNLPVRASQGD